MEKIKILEAGNELGMGGTEYVIQLFSKYLNKQYFDVTVVGIYKGGERAKLITDLGIDVHVLHGNLNKFAELIRDTDVFHWHGDGSVPIDLFNIIKDNKPKLVLQTNIFGFYDASPLYSLIDYDLFVSKMILVRRMFLDRGLNDNFSAKRKVLYNPVDVEQIKELAPTAQQVKDFKAKHKLKDSFIIGRIGRASNDKFDPISLEGFARFATQVSNARFLLVGATPQMIDYASNLNIIDKVIILETTSDFKQLLLYYKCIDVFLATSLIGESFGMVIAEAMTAGIPVLTISTERADNAQIELIDNGVTGIVTERNAEQIARALIHLHSNKPLRKQLSSNAVIKATKQYNARYIAKSLENLIYKHLQLQSTDASGSLVVDYSKELLDDYLKRCHNIWRDSSN